MTNPTPDTLQVSSMPPLSVVMSHVFGVIRKKLQVLNPVIRSFAVDMVNDLFIAKEPSEVCFHNQSMLSNILLPPLQSDTARVVRFPNPGVTARVNLSTALKMTSSSVGAFVGAEDLIVSLWSRKLDSARRAVCRYFVSLPLTLPRAISSLLTWIILKNLSTTLAKMFGHYTLFYNLRVKESI